MLHWVLSAPAYYTQTYEDCRCNTVRFFLLLFLYVCCCFCFVFVVFLRGGGGWLLSNFVVVMGGQWIIHFLAILSALSVRTGVQVSVVLGMSVSQLLSVQTFPSSPYGNRRSYIPILNTKRFKWTLIYFNTDTQYANFRVNPLYQATKWHFVCLDVSFQNR